MEFKIDRDVFLKSLAHVQGVVEKKNTLPILGNVLLEAHDGFLKITATDLDIIINEKLTCQTIKEGSTTTTAQVIYDIVRKLKTGSSILCRLIFSKILFSFNIFFVDSDGQIIAKIFFEKFFHKNFLRKCNFG